ncbi:MAG: ATP-binding cassette domain-containing protein [Bacteroidota bacterium]|nr:ATP-binding cassette domain-containing protein [Bacteroidota bacterium]
MDNFLSIDKITKQFERVKALDNVSFNVAKGQIFGLLGPNGAGKTTLIRIINRIFGPDAGNISMENEIIKSTDISKIGYLPEERGLYKKMKVGEQILFFAKLKGMNKTEAQKAADFWMKRLGIESWTNDKVEELSKGMQQKIQFIITVLHNPKLLIFDEPFSGFDPINVELIKKQILWLREQGTTIIFSTHNMPSVEEICERIVLINKGKNILEGDIDEIKEQFSENIFEISFDNISDNFKESEKFTVLDTKSVNGHTIFKVDLKDFDKKDFLKYSLENGSIISFNPVIPSLHDIFVKVVENYNKNSENE